MLLMGRLAACLGDKHTRAGRAASADARFGAEILSSALSAANGNRALSDDVRSAKLPDLLKKCFTDFPAGFQRTCLTPRDYVLDVESKVAYLFGRLEDRVRIERERIFGLKRTYDLLGSLVATLPSHAEAHAGAQSLVSLCLLTKSFVPCSTSTWLA